jgi:hypothetical protein
MHFRVSQPDKQHCRVIQGGSMLPPLEPNMTRCGIFLAAAWLLLMGLGTSSVAHAESSVVVLGVRSLDGEDELAKDVSSALREGIKRVPDYRVSDREVSLAQMSLAHSCDEPDARCMADIARTLEVDRLIYGTIGRAGTDFSVALFNFDAVSGQVESSLTETVPARDIESVALGPRMVALAKRLGGMNAVASLRVLGNVAAARVLVDNQDVGALSEQGELLVPALPAGDHTIAIENQGGRAQKEVRLEGGQVATVRIALAIAVEDHGTPAVLPGTDSGASNAERESARNWRKIAGYAAVGTAGVFAAATIYSWVRLGNIGDDRDMTAYREKFPGPSAANGTSDVCREADARTLQTTSTMSPDYAALVRLEASARTLCGEADSLEVLQYVFLGATLAAGGVGAYLLLTDGEPSKARTSRFSFRPHVGLGRAHVNASVRF